MNRWLLIAAVVAELENQQNTNSCVEPLLVGDWAGLTFFIGDQRSLRWRVPGG